MQQSINMLIVDDEHHNRVVLEKMIRQHIPGAGTISTAATVKDALALAETHQPSLVFLDIQMHGESGFDFLQQSGNYSFEVIFITAHDNYAIKAFRFNAVDYLLKPVVVSELKEAVDKAIRRIGNGPSAGQAQFSRLSQQVRQGNALMENITIPTADGFRVLQVRDIIYCQASNNYTILHLSSGGRLISSQTLGHYDELLTGNKFFRPHRSYLINIARVVSYKKGEGGFIVMSNGDEVELARNHKAGFLQLFKSQ